MNKRFHISVSGRVQGVCYRAATQQQACQLALAGTVRNLDDGRVEIIAEGAEPALQQLLAWCNEGPPRASVTQVEVVEEVYRGEFGDFTIDYGSL